MILRIIVQEMKDATGEKKRVLMSTLQTEIVGMESISAVAELDPDCIMSREIDGLIRHMISLKKEEVSAKREKEKLSKKSKPKK